jgi:hypothetical protein
LGDHSSRPAQAKKFARPHPNGGRELGVDSAVTSGKHKTEGYQCRPASAKKEDPMSKTIRVKRVVGVVQVVEHLPNRHDMKPCIQMPALQKKKKKKKSKKKSN